MTPKTKQKTTKRPAQRPGTRQTSRWTPVVENPFAVPRATYREIF